VLDDISSLRSLTPDVMNQEAAFLPMPAAVQRMETNGGWPEGTNSFSGPERSAEVAIPYYQKNRHIFGDLKIEILDQQGNLVDTVTSTKHRGVNRATWSMHLKGPKVPPAASALFGAAVGPRVVPGTYTVRMTKGDKVYNTKMEVVLDPRAKFTVEDRQAQFDLMMKLGKTLNHMSWAVDSIIGVRDQANANAAKLPQNDPLRKRLQGLSESADKVRTKIVATKEGGAITGEERLREYVGGLYGDVSNYEGRPTDSQARADALGRELDDVVREFTTITDQQLPPINTQLKAKKLGAIQLIPEAEWQKAADSEGGPGGGAMMRRGERD
jgi:hypothetical protein